MNDSRVDLTITYDDIQSDGTMVYWDGQVHDLFPRDTVMNAREALHAMRWRKPLAVVLRSHRTASIERTKPDLWLVRALSCRGGEATIHVWSCCGEGLFAVPFTQISSLFPIGALPKDAAIVRNPQIVLRHAAATAAFAALAGESER